MDEREAEKLEHLGHRFRKNKEYPEASTLYSVVLQAHPARVWSLVGLADCAREPGHYDRAVELLDEALTVDARHQAAIQTRPARRPGVSDPLQ